jgi:pimeloyl-ACP methyl ester carboxylesterase
MYIELGEGLKIKYYEHGKGNKRHVLFIHGLGASSLIWRDIPQALSEQFHTISVDLIGFGKSDKPPELEYTIRYFSQFIKSFLRQIEINDNEKIMIVGHSLGGYIAAEYAIENKDQIDKLVLIDSSGMLNQPTPLLEQYLSAALETDPILRYKKVTRVLEDLLADRSRLTPIFVDIFISIIGEPGAKHAFESAFRNSTSTPIDPKRLKQIENIPCLIIWGHNDYLIPSSHAAQFKDVLKNAKVILVNDAGHSPFAEKTAIIYEKIKTFLMEEHYDEK